MKNIFIIVFTLLITEAKASFSGLEAKEDELKVAQRSLEQIELDRAVLKVEQDNAQAKIKLIEKKLSFLRSGLK